jgi:glucose-6-phosphate 1-dehydrogenase
MPLQPSPHDRPRSDSLVMFGASGDLAKKKLFPALYRLSKRGLLGIPVTGVAIDDWQDADLVAHAEAAVRESGEVWDQAAFDSFCSRLHYVAGDYGKPETFQALRTVLGTPRHPVFHLAIPPSMFATVAAGIAGVGLDEGSRLIVEKPFGRDRASAVELNDILHDHFPESAIFRIDHFIGKEAMRNLMVTRFTNAMLEPLWHRHSVRSVKITMAEAFGVADRGAFYDSVGAMRDVMQNHLLQMVALLAMEQPVNEHSKALRDEKAKVLEATRAVDPAHYVRGGGSEA